MLYTPINHCVPRDQVSCRNFLKQLSWNIKPIFRLRIPTNHWITRNHILLLHWHTIKHLPSNFNKPTSKYNQITQFCKSTTNPNSIFFNSPWIYIPSSTKPTWEHVFKIKEKVNLSIQILKKSVFVRLLKLLWTWFQEWTPLALVLMNLSPRSSFWAPERVQSWARSLPSAQATKADPFWVSVAAAVTSAAARGVRYANACPWLQENLLSLARSSWKNSLVQKREIENGTEERGREKAVQKRERAW